MFKKMFKKRNKSECDFKIKFTDIFETVRARNLKQESEGLQIIEVFLIRLGGCLKKCDRV